VQAVVGKVGHQPTNFGKEIPCFDSNIQEKSKQKTSFNSKPIQNLKNSHFLPQQSLRTLVAPASFKASMTSGNTSSCKA